MACPNSIALQLQTFHKEPLFPYKCQRRANAIEQHSDVCVRAVNNGEIIPTSAFGQRNVRSL